MPAIKNQLACALCGTEVFEEKEGLCFCCAGCQAVYQILAARGDLAHFKDTSLFQEAVRAGLITNPQLIEEQRDEREKKGEELFIALQHLFCPSCSQVIEWVLLRKKGILSCCIDYATDFGKIRYDPQKISPDSVLSAIRRLGYGADRLEEAVAEQEPHFADRFRPWVAAFCALHIMMFSFPLYIEEKALFSMRFPNWFPWASALFSLPVVGWCALPLFRRGLLALRARSWGMETLVTVGVLSAWIFSLCSLARGSREIFFDSSSVLVTLTLFGNLLNRRAKRSAKQTMSAVAYSLPRKGRKQLSTRQFAFVPVKELIVGDRVLVAVGERIPVDGVILEGVGVCDESTWTGETLPVVKREGDEVLGGSLLKQGPILLSVRCPPEKMSLCQIAQMIGGDLEHRKEAMPFVDRISYWLIPALFLFAGTFSLWIFMESGWEEASRRLFSLLFIACPCSIGIAAPLAEARWIDRWAQEGVFIRNRRVLSLLGKETLIVFDKTGTITEGKMGRVEGIALVPGPYRQALKGLTCCSQHPIAQAISCAIEEISLDVGEIQEVIGRGMKGVWEGIILRLGSETFLAEEGIAVCFGQAKGKTRVFFAVGRADVYPIDCEDPLREGVAEMVAAFSEKTALLSGDHPDSVAALVAKCPFSQWQARLSPLEKREFVRKAQEKGECVSMIGDGVNDIAALAAADISWAVGSAADVTQQVADILLSRSDWGHVHAIRRSAKTLRRIVKQNLCWAFFYNLIGWGLAVAGMLTPLFAAGAMFVSSAAILLNTKRVSSHSR